MYVNGEFRKRIDDLEYCVLSCILLKPELMEKVILEDKHFVKTQKIWQFMKSIYKHFHTISVDLAYSICKDKYQIVEWLAFLLELEPTSELFETYQKQLLDLYNESDKEKWKKEKIYILANELLVGNINSKKFKEKMENIYQLADEIFDNEMR